MFDSDDRGETEMRMASLEAYGAHPDLLAAWMKHYNEDLLPIQERAVTQGQVLRGARVVGCGPTGCGKTFIAELAATHSASKGRRTIYLAPTKALAEEVFRRFQAVYTPLGLRVVIATQDRRAADRLVARGEFDLAVTVPEKLWAFQMASPCLVEATGALIVDELQMVADPDRGPCLELLLARFAQVPQVQIVGLSAVLSNGRELADWLGATLVVETQRPTELRKGVWQAGSFHYVGHNSGTAGEEPLPADIPDGASDLEAMVALGSHLASEGEPTLVFLRDRSRSVQAARLASREFAGAPAEGALAALAELPQTQSVAALREVLSAGVAFHNADLHLAERHAIERAFASGEVRALFATSTLAVGLNLPCRNVVIEPAKWHCTGGSPTLGPLPQAEYENMAGRAGRPGFGDEFGRALLVGEAGYDSAQLIRRYVMSSPEPVEGQLGRLDPAAQLLMRLAAQGPAGEAVRLLSRPRSEALDDDADGAAVAMAAGLVACDELRGRLGLTGLGRAAAASGMSLATAYALVSQLRRWGRVPTDAEALIMAAMTPEVRAVPLPRPHSRQHWGQALAEHCEEAGQWSAQAHELVWTGHDRAADRDAAARTALLCLAWTQPQSSEELEARTGLHAGRALAVAELAGWLVQGIARLAEELGYRPAEFERLRRFGEGISAALPEGAVVLRHQGLSGLHRDHILALWAQGLTTAGAVREMPDEELGRLLPSSALLEVRRALGQTGPAAVEAPGAEVGAVCGPAPCPAGMLLTLDAGRPDLAVVNGVDVPLRPMEFQLLSLLVRSPQRCVPFDALYDELWGSREAVEPQQIYWHRHNLSKKLMGALPAGSAELVRTIPRRGLMLDVPADRVVAA
jgi:helicase